MKIRLSIRHKLLFGSIMLALIPLLVAGNSLITISRDELKSSINDSLVQTSGLMAQTIDNMVVHEWRAPLLLMKSALDNPHLGVNEKVALLESGIRDVADFLSLQLYVAGFPPATFLKKDFSKRLEAAGLDYQAVLNLESEIAKGLDSLSVRLTQPRRLKAINAWTLAMFTRLSHDISGQEAVLAVHVDLDRVKKQVETHPMNRMGRVYLVDQRGIHLFDPAQKDLTSIPVVQRARQTLTSRVHALSVEPFTGPDGRKSLGGCAAVPVPGWAVAVAIEEADAYASIHKMQTQLTYWLVAGLLTAAVVALVFSMRVTRPILEIGRVVREVGRGDFTVRVSNLKTRDEIATLGRRINEMIQGLLERFHLEKFVSGETIGAVKKAGGDGVKLGGERKTATVLFSDIRNFTAFSEKVGPEVVIEMLNTYLSAQASIVRKYQGDIDKYVGDELIAVFQGKDMVRRAILCACEIHAKIEKLNEIRTEWDIHAGIGINTGDMVMGAMGSEDRMDYTILGDNVNLGARLCSLAGPSETILSAAARDHLGDDPPFDLVQMPPVRVKGKAEPIEIYMASRDACSFSLEEIGN